MTQWGRQCIIIVTYFFAFKNISSVWKIYPAFFGLIEPSCLSNCWLTWTVNSKIGLILVDLWPGGVTITSEFVYTVKKTAPRDPRRFLKRNVSWNYEILLCHLTRAYLSLHTIFFRRWGHYGERDSHLPIQHGHEHVPTSGPRWRHHHHHQPQEEENSQISEKFPPRLFQIWYDLCQTGGSWFDRTRRFARPCRQIYEVSDSSSS